MPQEARYGEAEDVMQTIKTLMDKVRVVLML
jgi:hypothetical protein